MSVDTASILRILAHELRSPAGVAQGYVRMTLDGRLASPVDQRRALEHTRDAIGRISAISREASEVASLIERPTTGPQQIAALHPLLQTVLERIGPERLDIELDALPHAATTPTRDEEALTTALTALVTAVLRESPSVRLTLWAAPTDAPERSVTIALGAPAILPDLVQGPTVPGAGPIPLERGGLGLSLVLAVLVLEQHAAHAWTLNDQRAAVGLRLPLDAGLHP